MQKLSTSVIIDGVRLELLRNRSRTRKHPKVADGVLANDRSFGILTSSAGKFTEEKKSGLPKKPAAQLS
jgi:hypothetical protein